MKTDIESSCQPLCALFIDRDGTILQEPADEQIDSYEKFSFVSGAIGALTYLRRHTGYKFVMVSNQDGLGTEAYPEPTFWPTHNLMLDILKSEGVEFDDILIDRSFEHENAPTRKPRTGMLTAYTDGSCDMSNSFVIGDRRTDAMLAANLGCRALILGTDPSLVEGIDGAQLVADWAAAVQAICLGMRTATVHRVTGETDIAITANLDGTGHSDIRTGLGFFDHMLDQIARHGLIDLTVHAKGDLHVDEHHTIEDTAIVLGECLLKALGDKRGIERYGFTLPMDDCLCTVALDFGGRPWLTWEAQFTRERVGEMPTEMFFHFFKSLSDAARMNLYIHAEGANEHHKIEAIFKALARAIRAAVRRTLDNNQLPSSKGVL